MLGLAWPKRIVCGHGQVPSERAANWASKRAKSDHVFGHVQKRIENVLAGRDACVSTNEPQTLPVQSRARGRMLPDRSWTIASELNG
jgi:hypothetical protein